MVLDPQQLRRLQLGLRQRLVLGIVRRPNLSGWGMRVASVVWGVLIIGVAGVLVAVASRGSQDAFRSAQSGSLTLAPPGVLSAAGVAAQLARQPEPVAAARRTPVAQVRCQPRGGGTLRNPWECTLRYRSGTQAHYLVQVEPDGSYSGIGTGLINGCCIEVPTLE